MKTLHAIFLFLATFGIVLSANAKQRTFLKLKDGSTIYGNIIVQRPGVDITIDADSVVLTIDDKNLMSSSSKNVKYENLSREWKRWALEKKALKGNANGRFMPLYSISTKGYSFYDVVKMGTTSDNKNKFYSSESKRYKFLWKDVMEICRAVPSATSDYIEDEITTSAGKTYQGTIVSQILNKQFTIKTKNGSVVIPVENIVETRRVAHKSSSKINDIADYTNTLVMSNNNEKEGIILAQHYGKNAKDKYVTLLLKNGSTEKILSSNIIEYQTNYTDTKKDVYRLGSVYVNEFLIGKAKTKTEGSNRLYIDRKVFPFPEGIVITFKSLGYTFQSDWQLVALESLKMENGDTTQGYSLETMENNSIKPSSVDMTGDMSSVSFNYLSPGYYALVSSSNPGTYIIKIVK